MANQAIKLDFRKSLIVHFYRILCRLTTISYIRFRNSLINFVQQFKSRQWDQTSVTFANDQINQTDQLYSEGTNTWQMHSGVQMFLT